MEEMKWDVGAKEKARKRRRERKKRMKKRENCKIAYFSFVGLKSDLNKNFNFFHATSFSKFLLHFNFLFSFSLNSFLALSKFFPTLSLSIFIPNYHHHSFLIPIFLVIFLLLSLIPKRNSSFFSFQHFRSWLGYYPFDSFLTFFAFHVTLFLFSASKLFLPLCHNSRSTYFLSLSLSLLKYGLITVRSRLCGSGKNRKRGRERQ